MQAARKILHIIAAGILLTLGLFGLVLPILNGMVLLILGLILLSFESRYVERKLFLLTQKNAFLHKWHVYLEKKMREVFRMEK